jgi:hypothetical protein
MDLSLQMVRDLPGLVKHHYKEGNFNWPMIVYISLVHTVAIAGLFALPRAKVETLLWAFALWPTRYELEAKTRDATIHQLPNHSIVTHLLSFFL